MADFQLYHFEPECVPNPEDSDPNNYFGFWFRYIHKLGKSSVNISNCQVFSVYSI